MRLFFRVALLMLVVGLVPIALGWLVMLPVSEKALRDRIDAHQAGAAEHASAVVAARVADAGDALVRSASFVDLGRAPAEVVQGVLRVVYRGSPYLTAVSALGPDDAPLAPSVYLAAVPEDPDLSARRTLGEADVSAHAAHIRPAEIRRAGRWWSEVYASAGGRRMVVAVTAELGAAGRPAASGRAVLLVAELDLERIAEEVAAITVGAGEGLLVSHAQPPGAAPLDLGSASEAVRAGHAFVGEATMAGERYLAAHAPAAATGLGVVVRQRLAVAAEPIAAMSRRLWYALGAAVVLVAALAGGLTRNITGRIDRLMERVAAVERGHYELPPLDLGRDEVGRLSRALDRMADEVRRRQEDVLELNRTLEARVEERTAELRRVEQRLAQAERLASIGTLGAGFAHEINNPLTSVLALAQLLGARTAEDDPRRRSIGLIEQETQRIAVIVARVLQLSNEAQPALGRVDVPELCARAVELAAVASDRIRVLTDVEVADAALGGSRDALVEVLEQLLRNAADAMRENGGKIELSARADERSITLEVRDEGCGIPTEDLSRAFDPFFTTKRAERAVGLGLSLVHRTVTSHHGDISLSSEVGKGTRVRLVLPRFAARSFT